MLTRRTQPAPGNLSPATPNAAFVPGSAKPARGIPPATGEPPKAKGLVKPCIPANGLGRTPCAPAEKKKINTSLKIKMRRTLQK